MFNKEEKIVLSLSILVISLLLILGLAKNFIFSDDKVKSEETVEIKEISLKDTNFEVEVNSELDTNVKSYINGNSKELKEVSLDFKDVDMSKPGTYKVNVKSGKNKTFFNITVKDTTAPVITHNEETLYFYLEPNDTIDMVIEYINATASDNVDGDLTSAIEGLPYVIPGVPGEVTYHLSVKDSSGNETTKDVVVIYQLP